MTKLGLKELNNAVFLKSDPDTEKAIILVQDYIAFGYPTKQIVNELLRKRGYLKKETKRLPIADNTLIEELLGHVGIICLEDIINALVKCSDPESNFEAARQAIWPI